MSEAFALLLYKVTTVIALLSLSTAYRLAKAMVLCMCTTSAAFSSLLTSRHYTVDTLHAYNIPAL
jgi:hypothetical protein